MDINDGWSNSENLIAGGSRNLEEALIASWKSWLGLTSGGARSFIEPEQKLHISCG